MFLVFPSLPATITASWRRGDRPAWAHAPSSKDQR